MKKIITTALILSLFTAHTNAQGLNGLIKKATKKDSTSGKSLLDKVSTGNPLSSGPGHGLSNDEIISGLKEALKIGTDSSSAKLSKVNGFFGDAAIKILMPEDAKKVETTLRSLGMGSLVDKTILSLNRAAEDAAGNVNDIFWKAIKQMTVTDGLQILRGGDFAATDYLKKTTTVELTEKFRPVIDSSLVKVDATKYWKELFTTYNKFTPNKINPDLTAYVTEKALSGLFLNIGLQEQKIRKDPAAQVTNLLKTVFGSK